MLQASRLVIFWVLVATIASTCEVAFAHDPSHRRLATASGCTYETPPFCTYLDAEQVRGRPLHSSGRRQLLLSPAQNVGMPPSNVYIIARGLILPAWPGLCFGASEVLIAQSITITKRLCPPNRK